jgi:uncharacterized protein
MPRPNPDPTTVAILAKAPVAGFAKTRLIPILGAHAAAVLQERLTERAVAMACDAAVGPVVLWGAPDCRHAMFRELARRYALRLLPQPAGDLGTRMLAAVADTGGPTLVIGTDCPALTAQHLHAAAEVLRRRDAVVVPAEDGGYVLIGMRRPHRAPFTAMPWGSATVMTETRQRVADAGLSCEELESLWDVDNPADMDRLEREGFADLLS